MAGYLNLSNFLLFLVILVNWLISSAIVSAEIESNTTNDNSTTFSWMVGYNFAPMVINMIILLVFMSYRYNIRFYE
jgi:hypothetical protein